MPRMIMGLFIGYGHGPRGWDDPGLRDHYDWRRPELYQDLALVCERGIFDVMVFADVLGIPEAFRGRRTPRFVTASRAFVTIPFRSLQ